MDETENVQGNTEETEEVQEYTLEQLCSEECKSKLTLKNFTYVKNAEDILRILKGALKKGTRGINILFLGLNGSGKKELAKVLATKLKVPLYVSPYSTEFAYLFNMYEVTEEPCITLAEYGENVLLNPQIESFKVQHLLAKNPYPVIWLLDDLVSDGVTARVSELCKMTCMSVFESPSVDLLEDIAIKEYKRHRNAVFNKDIITEMCKKYKATPEVIINAVNADCLAKGNSEVFKSVMESNASVLGIDTRGSKAKDLSSYDISLVNADIDIVKFTEKIKAKHNLAFRLCLYGKSGTGKSEYAKYLAQELGIPTILKKASDILSKWQGEAEQNIAKAFQEAKDKGAMLIIDEADTFLADRAKASESWEMTKVNEMLTQMEEFEMPFVITTNLMDAIDKAALRRFSFKICFNALTKEQYKRAFKEMFNLEPTKYIGNLTIGDLANVKRQVDFLDVEGVGEIESMLEKEVKTKDVEKKSVGF